jgi:CP family cyanate transporter-like MFS transporter
VITPPIRHLWAGRTLALLGILLVAANLRIGVAALSPIISYINVDIPLDALAIGILGMLPPVCFAFCGILTPLVTRRMGLEKVLIMAIMIILFGHFARGISDSFLVLLMGSAITFAGSGAGNVLLPPLVKKYFPDRVGLLTSLYATMLMFSTLVPPLVAVPVAEAGSWRISLGMWALLALLALIPWIIIISNNDPASTRLTSLPEEVKPALLGRVWHSSIAWALAIVFAGSSLNAYAMFAWLPQVLLENADVSAQDAGTLLSLYAAMGIPASLVIPILATRVKKSVGPIVALGIFSLIAGYTGLLLTPTITTWAWVSLAGIGSLLFPLSLVLINLRTRTHQGAVALSGFVQSIGYTIGATGPLLFGLLKEVSGGWDWPLIFLIGSAIAITAVSTIVSRPHLLEDDLHSHHQKRQPPAENKLP